ncbi:MAG: hypothetical protein KF788_09645 [Piscinibacter sp.]|nr:hypothetical protein [Piscinibacter sp.]
MLALVGCGGGGGGDGGGPVVPPPVSSGLIPPAPVQGDILFDDATALRPLVAGGMWTYRGSERSVGDGGAGDSYTNTVTHQASPAGGVVEAATDADHGGDVSQRVRHVGGEVRSLVPVDLGDGRVRTLEQVELRSPVRVGDQYTFFDLHLVDSGFDVDGDGRVDELDVASYTRVVGKESVAALGYIDMEAALTRTWLVARFKLSSTGAYTDVESGTLDIWYAPGIGVVRRSTDVPGFVPEVRVVTSEELAGWDGVTRGLGYLPPVPAVSPSGARLKYALGVAQFDAHAVLMTQATDVAVQGIALSRVNSRGEVQSTTAYTGINASRAVVVGVGGGVRVLAMSDSGLRLHAYDVGGAAETASPVDLLPPPFASVGGREFVVAASGDTIWVAWIPYPTEPVPTSWTLQVQPFTAAGEPLAAPSVLASVSAGTAIVDVVGVSAPDRAAFSWNENVAGAWYKRYAVIEGGGARTPSLHTLSTAPNGSTQFAKLASSSTGLAMLWQSVSSSASTDLLGVSIAPDGGARRSNALEIDENEPLALPWLARSQALRIGSGPKVDIYTRDFQKPWPEAPNETFLSQVGELTPGTGPLSTDHQGRLLARGEFPVPSLVVGLVGNVLAIADEPAGVTITSVWRRP